MPWSPQPKCPNDRPATPPSRPAAKLGPATRALATTVLVATALVTAAFAAPSASAQPDIWKAVRIEPVPVRDNLTMLKGRGGNLALSVGDQGAFLVDDQFAELEEKIRAAIGELTDQPVRFLVNTHWHFDHTGGNEKFGRAGTVIVAHENVRRRMATDQVIEALGTETKASPPAALPVITFADEVTFHWNGDTVRVFHVPNAHTDGDAILHFVEDDVFHMGDVFFNRMYPFIDRSSGGDVNGVIRAVDLVLEMCTESTRIIPGHGELSNPTELREYRDLLVTVRDRIRKLVDEGKSLADVYEAAPTAEYDAVWGQGFMDPKTWTGILYNCLSRERSDGTSR